MKQVLIITGLLMTMSCSVFKHKTTSSSTKKDLTVHSIQGNDSLQITAQTQYLRLQSANQMEITEIIPEGKFVYKPDSGFSGAAKRVRVYRHAQQRSVEKDTSSLRLAAGTNTAGVDSILHQQAQQQVEETRKSKPATSAWVYMLLAVLLLAGWVYWKKYDL